MRVVPRIDNAMPIVYCATEAGARATNVWPGAVVL